MNEYFSLRRLGWLLRADLAKSYRMILTVSATLAAIMVVASFLAFDSVDAGQTFFLSWYGGMLYVWGIVGSSRAFAELHDKSRNEAYLLIPASAIEKTVVRLLAFTVGLCVYLLIFTTSVSILVAGIHRVLPGTGAAIFNPFDARLWPLIAGYLFPQSLYFLGAAWFSKRHLIKTTLAIVLTGIGLGLFGILTLRVVFAPEAITDLANFLARAVELFPGLLRMLDVLWTVVVAVLTVACWSIAWLRLREAQASDAV